MQALPSHDRFARAAGQTFRIRWGTDGAIEAELRRVDARVPMNERHECFSLLFALPPGVALPQALYHVGGPEGIECALMLTPVRPEPDGRTCLEAVFHRLKTSAAA
jgi:hypothetical protein